MAEYKSKPLDGEAERLLLAAVNAQEAVSYGSDSDGELSDECARNIDRYLGRNIFPAPEGRSQVRDRSVYESVQFIQPSLSRIFANGDDVVELPPIGPEDMESSKQEAQFLNHILLQKNNWFEIFDTASKDALITKRGYLYPYAEKRETVEIEKYERQTPESLGLIMQDQPEIVSQREYPDPDYKPQPQVIPDPMTGQPAMGPDGQPIMVVPPPQMLYDVEIRRVKKETKYCIEVLPPERCKVSEKTKTVQVADSCPYFEFYDFPTLSELRQDGFEVDDDISATDADDSLEDTARNLYGEESHEDSATDSAMRRVKCRWVWIRHDFNQDGIAELQYCIIVGSKVLHREECSRIPIAVLCPDKLPHRHIGMCPADTAGDIEDIKTVVLRQGLDNLYLSQNPQKFADPKYVNLDDMLVSRPGGITRLKTGAVFGQNFGVYPIPFVFPETMQGLEYMDQIKENRVGVNRYFTGVDQNALNKTKGGMEMLSTMSGQRVEQIARHYANGVEVLCSLLHEIVLKSGHKKEVIQLRGKWVEVDPTTWRKRTDFRTSVGFAAGNKDQQVQRLMMIANMQKEAAMGGLPIVTPENIYETAIEITKATDMQAPNRFWTEPSKAPQKGPPEPDVTVMAMEQIKSQTALQTTQMDVEQKERDSQRDYDVKLRELETKAALDLTKHREQLAHGQQTEQFKAESAKELKRMEATHGDDELVGARTRAEKAGKDKEQLEQTLVNAIQELKQSQEAVQGALQVLINSRRQIRRGADGKAEGVDVVTPDGQVIASQKIVRGPDNKAIGTA